MDDLVAGFLRHLDIEDAVTGAISIGNPREYIIRGLAAKVIALTSSRSEIVQPDWPQVDPKQRRPDFTPAKALLDWEPTVPLEEGLRFTIDHFHTVMPNLQLTPTRRLDMGRERRGLRN